MRFDHPTGHPNILAVQLRRLGDLVLATPAFRAIKNHHPNGRLTVLTEPPFHEVLEGLPEVDEILLHPRGALRSAAWGIRLGRKGWDIAFDFHGNPTSARLTAQSGAPVRIGFALRGRRLAYTRAVELPPTEPPRYTADMKLDLVRAAGIPALDSAPRIHVTREEQEEARRILSKAGVSASEPFLFVAPASRRAYKRWPLESFARVIRDFRTASASPVAIIGGPGEEPFLTRLSAMTTPEAPIIRPESIRSLMACLSLAAVFAGPDGGAKQLAQALERPTLALFGPQNPSVWTNTGLPHAVIRGRRIDCPGQCSKFEAACSCLGDIPVSEVSRRLIELWEATQGTAVR